MTKMIIGTAIFCSMLSTASFAATTASSNNVPNPCYNGGLSFGLAGYTPNQMNSEISTANSACPDKPTDDELAKLKTLFS